MKINYYKKQNLKTSAQVGICCFMMIAFTFLNSKSNAQLLNGSFEIPPNPSNNSNAFLPSPLTSTSWNSSEGVCEIWNGVIPNVPSPGPKSGHQYLELNAFQCGNIWQSISMSGLGLGSNPTGAQLTYSFWHSGRGGVDEVEVLFGGDPNNMVHNDQFSDGALQWGYHAGQFCVQKNDLSEIIMFKCMSPQGSAGNFLDSIVVTAIPCPPIIIQSTITYQPVCQGCVSVNISGGCPPYAYSWSNGATVQNPCLLGGIYTITVTDLAGNVKTKSINVSPPKINIVSGTYNNHADSCCTNLIVTGGTPGYNYAWATVPARTTKDICSPDVPNGWYHVTVTDTIGCTASDSVLLNCHKCIDSCLFWAVGGNNKFNGGHISEWNNTNNILGINDVGLGGTPPPIGPQINLSPLRIFTNSTEKMRILSTGEVGINTTTGTQNGIRLQVNAIQQNGILSQVRTPGNCAPSKFAIKGQLFNSSAFRGSNSFAGYFTARSTTPTPSRAPQNCNDWAGYFIGDIMNIGQHFSTNAGGWISDSTLKQNINNIPNALMTINLLNPKSFDFKVNDYPFLNLPVQNQFGFIAQDVKNVLPNLVDSIHIAEETDSSNNVVYSGGNFLSLNYIGILPIAIAGIKELDLKVNNLSASSVKTSCPLTTYHLPKSSTGDSICNSQIYDDGNGVGVGTDTVPAGYKMVVEGKFGARDIIVACPPSWPDYVFDATHLLKPLDDLENYVTANKHLPGIPSANEIEKSGINVGEMQTKQMEKIEELYQYIIQMNKNVQRLSAENKQLKELMKNVVNK